MKIPLSKLKESLNIRELFPSSKFPTEEELREKEESFSIGDRVKVSNNIRCKQKGKTGTIVAIRPGSHGWKDFSVEFDDPKDGVWAFQSGSIDHLL